MIKHTKGFILISFIIAFIIAVAGIYATFKLGSSVAKNQREKILLRAENIAVLINENDIKKLSGLPSDISLKEYQDLKTKMVELKNVNPDARFFYLMGLRDNTQMFFFVDSESETSEGYSAPGDPFNEPTEQELSDFRTGTSGTQGPVTDSWGTWVSAYAPIKDSETRETLAVIGIDINAKEFRNAVLQTKFLVGGVSLFLLLFVVSLILYIRKSHEAIRYMSKQSDDLALSYSYLKETKAIAALGRVSLNIESKNMEWDETVMDIFEIPDIAKPNFDIFLSHIVDEDQVKVKKVIEEAVKRNLDSFRVNFNVKTESVTKTVFMTGTVRNGSNGNPTRIVATIQDITGNV